MNSLILKLFEDKILDWDSNTETVFFQSNPSETNNFTFERGGLTAKYRNHFNIYQLSPNLYKTFKGYAAHDATNDKLFVTPVPACNSIKGGLGYFGACLVQTIRFEHNGEWYFVDSYSKRGGSDD